ncbi:MAG: group II intron reverse transcriptase/maturase [Acidiferrobacterales bacterium]
MSKKLPTGRPARSKEGRPRVQGESDSPIVLRGRERRPQGEGVDRDTPPAKDTCAGRVGPGKRKPTSLQALANKAKADKRHRFQNLYGLIDETLLLDAWRHLNKRAASGVDCVSAQAYEKDLASHVARLVETLKGKRYRAKLVRRHYIPKGKDKWRPLGVPAVEDKLLQTAVARILQAIYEQDFLGCSYGYRRRRGAGDAVRELTKTLQFGRYGYIVEADIAGFFDHIDHDWLLHMLQARIDDKALLGLIRKWLKAGILDTDGQVLHPETGTPQGGIVSPVLANVYLHYALDLWFEKVVKRCCRGDAYLCRYADDYVCAFQYQSDAKRFYSALAKRLGKFALTLAPDKTRVIAFSRHRKAAKSSFEFLGFEFRWGVSRAGRDLLRRRTARKRFRVALARFTEGCKQNRHRPLRELFALVNAQLRGHYYYYGVVGNFASLKAFFYQARRILFKWLNRRGQRRSYTWDGFEAMLRYVRLELPRITELPTRQ